jgi:hypothetical protein
MLTMSRLTREFVHIDVGSDDDLTPTEASIAFVAEGQLPTEGDWYAAELAPVSESEWRASVLVGPGADPGVTLPVGAYQTWVRLVDSPEMPVMPVGILEVL